MITTVKLHGFMGQKYGKTVKLSGENMFQIMSGLVSRFGPGFKEDVRTNSWHLVNGAIKPGNDLGEGDLHKSLTKKVLHLVPVVAGASAALRIVIGIVLIVAAAFGYGNAYTVQLGISLILGGVVEMLTKPKPGAAQQHQDDRGSYIYNAAVNVTSQGGPVPLIYGRVQRASSVVISTDFSSDEVY